MATIFGAAAKGKVFTNAPNLVDRIKFVAGTSARARGRGQLRPTFDKQTQAAQGKASASGLLIDRAKLVAAAKGKCSVGSSPSVSSASLRAGVWNHFTSSSHDVRIPSDVMVTLYDTYIDRLSWTQIRSANHVLEIQDAQGRVVVRCSAAAANDTSFVNLPIGMFVPGGYKVTILDSGSVSIIIGKPPRNS